MPMPSSTPASRSARAARRSAFAWCLLGGRDCQGDAGADLGSHWARRQPNSTPRAGCGGRAVHSAKEGGWGRIVDR